MTKKDNIQYILNNMSVDDIDQYIACVATNNCYDCVYYESQSGCGMQDIANKLWKKEIDLKVSGNIIYKGQNFYLCDDLRKLKLFDIVSKKKRGKKR